MSYPATPLRRARKTGRHPEATIMWDGQCGDGNLHVGRVRYAEGYVGDEIPDGWLDVHPEACDRCGAPFDPEGDHKHSGTLRIEWDTPSGKLEPGCCWVNENAHRSDGQCWSGWTNCDGRHVHVVLPNGSDWDLDGRARNCGSPDDTTHRCWVRVGDPEHPETLHVSKDGKTCAAGAGSISAGDYHGFLVHGTLSAG